MLKKRLIFTLLYNEGLFVQSRNFNIQNVGNLDWLKRNYNFRNISFFIDELIILDISRNKKDKKKFIENVQKISELSFVPITVGGGIKTLDDAKYFLSNGSDKILINSEIHKNKDVINKISEFYGEQSIVLGVDIKKIDNQYFIFTNNGKEKAEENTKIIFEKVSKLKFGEIFINSIDKDGTGTGLDFDILNFIPKSFKKPIIISGGSGNFNHIFEGLNKKGVSAVSTSNLLNFVGDGLIKTRNELISRKIPFPVWNINILKKLENKLKE